METLDFDYSVDSDGDYTQLELDLLMDALSSDDPSVQCNAAAALADLGAHATTALFALETAIGDEDEALQQAAENAICRIRDDIREQQESALDE